MNNMEKISNCDLYNKRYSKETLVGNINNLCLITILKTQHVDYDFIVNYALNPKYQITSEETYIDIYIVLQYQTHIKEEIIRKMLNNK